MVNDASTRATSSDSTLVIHLWWDLPSDGGFRARVILAGRVTAEPVVRYVNDPDQVLRIVREWLIAHGQVPGPDSLIVVES